MCSGLLYISVQFNLAVAEMYRHVSAVINLSPRGILPTFYRSDHIVASNKPKPPRLIGAITAFTPAQTNHIKCENEPDSDLTGLKSAKV